MELQRWPGTYCSCSLVWHMPAIALVLSLRRAFADDSLSGSPLSGYCWRPLCALPPDQGRQGPVQKHNRDHQLVSTLIYQGARPLPKSVTSQRHYQNRFRQWSSTPLHCELLRDGSPLPAGDGLISHFSRLYLKLLSLLSSTSDKNRFSWWNQSNERL